MGPAELDVRTLRPSDRHAKVFATFTALEPAESFVLVNDHDPVPLRDEFETEHPGGYGWDYLEEGPVWHVLITKRASTPLPRLLVDTTTLPTEADASGAVFKLTMHQRDLDSNIIRLPPGESIAAHAGPDLDVLVYVLAGSGRLGTELESVDLRPGGLLWLPRRSQRQFEAGRDGLTYLTVHGRRQSLQLLPPAPRD